MYNGYSTQAVNSGGAHKNSITKLSDKVVGRGVLLDIARYKGKPWLETSEPIHKEDLEGCAAKQQIEVSEGDIVLVRTHTCLHDGVHIFALKYCGTGFLSRQGDIR
jgi:hypothetical protein